MKTSISFYLTAVLKNCRVSIILLLAAMIFGTSEARAMLPPREINAVNEKQATGIFAKIKAEILPRLSFFKKLAATDRAHKDHVTLSRKQNNRFGILSLACCGISILAATLTGPALILACPLGAAAAVVLGLIGISKDKNKGLAIAGLAIGLVTLDMFLISWIAGSVSLSNICWGSVFPGFSN